MHTRAEGSKTMKRFCPNCGNQTGENAKFCGRCGMTLNRGGTVNTASGTGPGYTSKSSKTYRTDGGMRNVSVPPPFSAKPQSVRAASGKKLPLLKIAALIVVFALLLGGIARIKKCADSPDGPFSGLAGSGIVSPGSVNIAYSDSDYKKARSVSIAVTPGSSAAVTEGISADFGDFNIREDYDLEIKTLRPKTDRDLGLTARLYDFTVTGESGRYTEFALPVDVTLPCSAAADEIAFIQVYDKEEKTWTMIPCSRDTEAGTISFRTSHFSGFGEFTSTGEVLQQIPGSVFSYVGEYRGQTTPVMITDGDIDKLLSGYHPETVKYTLLNGKIPPGDTVSSTFGVFNNLSSGIDAATGAEMGIIDLTKVFKGETIAKMNPVLTAVGTALVLGKISYQLYKGVDMATVISDNAFNMVESGLAIIAFYTGAAPVAFAATAVFAAGFIYDMSKSEEPGEWDEYTYHYFNRNNMWFNTATFEVKNRKAQNSSADIKLDIGGDGCAAAVAAIYKKHESDPKKLYSELEKFISSYTGAFWLQDRLTVDAYYKEMLHEHYFYEKTSAPGDYPYPGEDRMKICRYNFENRLKGNLHPLLKEYAELSYLKLKEALLKEMNERYVPMLNEIITFEIVDPETGDGTFDRSEYANPADYQIMLGEPVISGFNSGGLDYSTARDHTFTAGKDTNVVFRCSMYAYMSQGMPNTIEIDRLNDSSELMTFPFIAETPVTVINLGQRSETAGSLLFTEGPDRYVFEQIIGKALGEQGVIKLDPAKKGLFKITGSSSATDTDNEKEKADDYKLHSETVTLSSLVIEGIIADESACKISATVRLTGNSSHFTYDPDIDLQTLDTSEYTYDYEIRGTGTADIVTAETASYLFLTFSDVTVTIVGTVTNTSRLTISSSGYSDTQTSGGKPVTEVVKDAIELRFRIN